MGTVRLPEWLHGELRRAAEERGAAIWEVVADAWAFYQRATLDPQRAAYYIVKLCYSASVFKLDPSPGNLAALEATASQLAGRLGVDTSELIEAAKRYAASRSPRDLGGLNAALKRVILALMGAVCGAGRT